MQHREGESWDSKDELERGEKREWKGRTEVSEGIGMRGNKRPKQRGVISENIEEETNQKGNFGEGLQYFSFSFSSSPPSL